MSKIYTVGTLYIEFYCIFEFPAEQPEAPHYCLSTILLKRNLHIRPLPISSSGVRLVVKMDSTANILQFCRLCLVKDGVNIPIFDEQGDIRQIYLKISSCLPVKVAREDHLPKKICDGCSNKLDICYDFWRTSAESEKQLLAWLGATGKDAAQVNVKEEDNFDEPLASDISKNDDDENKCYMFEQKVEEGPPVEINDEPPPSKRPRRTAAMEDDSDETDGDDREPAFVDVPSTSADDQPGPSGVSKDGSDAPWKMEIEGYDDTNDLQCEECFAVFICEKELSIHWSIEHGPKLYPCNICGLKFILPSILKTHTEVVHIKSKSLKKLHQCYVCLLEFNTEELLEEHHELVHPKGYHCGHCGIVFKSKEKLRQHIRGKHISFGNTEEDELSKVRLTTQLDGLLDNHENNRFSTKASKSKNNLEIDNKRPKFVCSFCGKNLSSLLNLKKHMDLHSFHCDVCPAVYDSIEQLAVHKREHGDVKPYICTVCSMRFNQDISDYNTAMTSVCRVCSMCDLREHAPTCFGTCKLTVPQGRYICQFCAEVFNTRHLLNKHVSNSHRSRYVCNTCGKPSFSTDALRKHMQTCVKSDVVNADAQKDDTLIKEEYFKCTNCAAVYRSEDAFKRHLARYHTPCVCEKCGKVLCSLDSLEDHTETVHNEAKPFACTICDKRCKRAGDLRIHMRIHTGERPYNCKLCSKSFINISNFKNHLCRGPREESTEGSSVERAKDKQYNCPFCAQSFNSKESATSHVANNHNSYEHIPTHNGVKRFLCTVCGKGFLRHHHLVRHSMVHTVEKPFRCETCLKGFARRTRLRQHKCRGPPEQASAAITPKGRKRVAMSPLPCLQLRIKPEDVQLHWSCPECLGAFITLEQLFSHSREVHSSDMYHCDVCSKMYREMRQLHQHKQFVHQTAPTYECSECPEIFKTQKQFASHRRMVHIYKCNLCGKKFGLAEMLEIHRKAVHTKEWYYECPLCKEIFKTEEQLCDHLKEMHSPVYPCDVFETKTQLSRHKAAIHYTLIHPCTVCGIIFQEPDKLELHKNCHTNEVQHKKFHTNEEQHMMFQTNEEQHEKSHTNEDQRMEFHTNKEQHKESHTNKQKTSNESNEADATNNDDLKCPDQRVVANSYLPCLQLRVKPEDVQLHWSCPECLGTFNTLEQLFSHSREVHSSDMYHCHLCGKMYQEVEKLHQHKYFMHPTSPTYECSECPEGFETQRQFATHRKMVHTYNCNICGKRFRLAELLEIHRKVVHPQEWYYECSICNAIFKTEEQMCEHLKEIHSPDVYPCDVCKETLQLLKVQRH
ncbi:unnamed protein product [Callosobruchus maculatus]|uniref:Uncharacterized protein n=1 Tax=Callosobruchus maculatus TaxID=64391 RepID=A0A653C2F7_CALMS|nr:unnamed protein product [Callosobruchus maculatus]